MVKRGTIAAFAVAVAVGLSLVVASYLGVHSQRWFFEHKLAVGMSKAEVLQRIGEPAMLLMSGDKLTRWGNSSARTVTAETWVYFGWPASQHRFVLTYEDERMAAFEHQQN
jgi:hypothetical protein